MLGDPWTYDAHVLSHVCGDNLVYVLQCDLRELLGVVEAIVHLDLLVLVGIVLLLEFDLQLSELVKQLLLVHRGSTDVDQMH